ncbi:integrase (plasmid) [Bacillus sp. S3]|uniref:tyrosine-type recombinase/integrase n=1 Tax=Bacillus sp. S3 TaxID=486398 RepID=UPI00118D30D5|nr:phage integrase N-terminal SAM-like domain-containing protein [Bacillus sp. S3]QCJ45476.1 integrase [Bacillus sp. S3]
MPYGFIKHLENEGYSEETVKSYEKIIVQFFSFIQSTYPGSKEPFQISSTDIKNYLEEQLNNEKTISTINKELAILKTLFNYLWEIDKVPVDPAVKIKRFKVKNLPKVDVTFEELEELLIKVLQNGEYSKLRKVIFLLATKGLKTADFRFKKEDVKESIKEDTITIQLRKRTITLVGREVTYFQEYFYETIFNGSDYVFTTKPHGEEYGGPIQVMSILNHLRAISSDYLGENVQPLTLISIRRAIAFHLYSQRHSIQAIAKKLGIEENSASNYLKYLTEGTILPKST